MLALAAVIAAGAGSTVAPDWADDLGRLPADWVDPALPGNPFGAWLSGELPRGAVRQYRSGECGMPAAACHVLEFDLISRARRLELWFDARRLDFIRGAIGAPGLETPLPITTLDGLGLQLAQPIPPRPLGCPAGTVPAQRAEYAGLHEWCENAQGQMHGPARAWFSTGRYLMHEGAYREGARTGRWLECNRFERCGYRVY